MTGDVLTADDLRRRFELRRQEREFVRGITSPMIDPDFDGDDDLPELHFEPLENYQ